MNIDLTINGQRRSFREAKVAIDLANASSSADIKFRFPQNTALDAPLDEVILGENPLKEGYGENKDFIEAGLSVGGSAAWATAVASPVAYYADEAIPQPGDTVFADENNPQAMDPVYL